MRRLALALLMAWVLADYAENALAAHRFALSANGLY